MAAKKMPPDAPTEKKKSTYKPAPKLTNEEAMTKVKAELPVLRQAGDAFTNLTILIGRSTDFTFPVLEETSKALEAVAEIKKSLETVYNTMIVRGRSKLLETKLKPVMPSKEENE